VSSLSDRAVPAEGRTLILGGTRSGKSGYAEDLLPADAPVRYLATARRYPNDPEWSQRIEAHRARRPAGWTTEESPSLPTVLASASADELLLVDDLATWLTGQLDDVDAWESARIVPELGERLDALVDAVARCPARLVLVSAEVGLGVVPATRSGRLFRDELGALNARLARTCDTVVLLVAGIPLQLR
jgi:adenosyl cobinamide kinase/adenosyl cobinamide phosphate guanylyltransferase